MGWALGRHDQRRTCAADLAFGVEEDGELLNEAFVIHVDDGRVVRVGHLRCCGVAAAARGCDAMAAEK